MKSSVFFLASLCLALSILLQLPAFGTTADSVGVQTRGDKTYIIHKIDKGDTYYSISRRYKVDVKELQSANKNKPLGINDEIRVPSTSKPAYQDAGRAKIHIVQPGETLYAISKKYAVSVDDIKKWNRLPSNTLSTGQKLAISASGGQQSTPRKTSSSDKSLRTHIVQGGETLYSISKKYDVDVTDIRQWNRLEKYSELSIGQRLIIKTGNVNSVKKIYIPTTKPISEKGLVVISGAKPFGSDFSECQHATAPIGSIVRLQHRDSGKVVWVKCIGRLDADEKAIIKINKVALKKLDSDERVFHAQVSYIPDMR